MLEKRLGHIRRHKRVRAKVKGISERPRLSAFRSNRHILVQLVDDISAKTLAAASDLEIKSKIKKERLKPQIKDDKEKLPNPKVTLARKVGELIAERALKKKISQVVFDRGGYKYHGAMRAVAEGARKGGLKL